MTVNNKLLSVGDVIEADKSWRIKDFNSAKRSVTIDQNMTDDGIVCYNGRECSDVTYSGGEVKTLSERVQEAGLTVQDKFFLVLIARMEGGSSTGPHNDLVGYPDGHYVVAKECDAKGNVVENGLKAQFYQTGYFNTMVKKTKVIGRRPVKLGAFKPS